MSELVRYRLEGPVATITMDDGKVNALSPTMLGAVDAALDRAEKDAAIVLLTGREGVFSAGFDLRVLRSGKLAAIGMVRSGFELAARVLAHPRPVVMACNGHAMAMGGFLLLAGDYRIGVSGPFKLVVNEVAIGLTMPRAGVEICRQRLAPAHFHRAVLLSEVYGPEESIEAGFLDRVVAAEDLVRVAHEHATSLAKLDLAAHAATKIRARKASIDTIRASIIADTAELFATGVKQMALAKLRPGNRSEA